MNNKGFTITTLVYMAIILLSTIMFTTLAIESSNYENQKDFIKTIDSDLNNRIIYKVTVEIVNGNFEDNSDKIIKKVDKGNNLVIKNVKKTAGYELKSITCTPSSTTGTLSGEILTITNINSDATCTITFE